MRRFSTVLTVLLAGLVLGAGPALAHEERESQFPSGKGVTPTYRTFEQAADRLVVCKPSSAKAVAEMKDARLRAFNQKLLKQCRFQHLQAAVDAVKKQKTNIYVLPGLYREEPSHAPACTKAYDGGVVEYDLIVSCGEVINLVTIAGDDPKDADTVCDNALCRLQVEGTGEKMTDVVFRGGFTNDGDWVKHNGIKADRADGFYLRNLTAELFRENALYVHETDGYVLDRVNARNNDLYGILTFTSDHGLIQDCDTSFNGDSGVYPGSAADVNALSTVTAPLTRYAVEIRRCKTYYNALGFSGTAGNSVWFHDNEVFSNGAGYVTDSFVGGHPGMPQDHAYLTKNKIFSNNSNYYERFVHSGICDKKPGERGYGKGTVCPAFPVPVGTGVMIAGGNRNLVTDNLIYDNWRTGAMLFWVPAAIRGEMAPTAQYDTSNGNHFTRNRMGFHPSGVKQPNGTDFWWDDQGVGNCWETNTSVRGEITHNATSPLGLPLCASPSLLPVGNATKSVGLLPCSQYNREDNKDPVGCDWFDNPTPPTDREAAPGQPARPPASADLPGISASSASLAARDTAPGLPATGGSWLLGLAGAGLVGAVLAARRRNTRVGAGAAV
ncbi:MAG: right-handed parallel beta-helix repeat-containing protein [Mycobacteriales bacterium]|nr:right-handed parallel beta-helix repeat-containing protein [Mycobacteriales bacterium]